MFLFGIHLTLKQYSEDKLALLIPLRFRLFMILIALFILFALLNFTPGGITEVFTTANTVPLLLVFFSLLSSLYQESWTWERSTGLLQYKFGLLFLYKHQTIELSDLERVEVSLIKKSSIPGKPRAVIALSLHDRKGNSYRLENSSFSRLKIITTMGESIALFCEIPLVKPTA